MASSTSTSIMTTVYLVLRKDFDHHTDRKGRLAAPIGGAYRTLAAANAAAEAHCEAEAGKGFRAGAGEDPEHDEVAGGLYYGRCNTREDRRDHFEVRVKAMKLLGGDDDAPAAAAGNSGGKGKGKGKGAVDGRAPSASSTATTKKRKSDVAGAGAGAGEVGRGPAKSAKSGGGNASNSVIVLN